MFKRRMIGVRFCLFRLRDRLLQPGKLDLAFLKPNECMVTQFVFHSLRL